MKLFKLFIVLAIASPLQGMQRFMQTGLRPVLAAYRYQLQPHNNRFLQDFSHIKGLYELGVKTPIVGLFATSSLNGNQDGDLLNLLQSNQNGETSAFAKLFFHMNPVDREISITQYNKYMIRVLPIPLIASLLETTGVFDTARENSLIEEWHKKYSALSDKINDPIKNRKNFDKKAKQFLKDFRSSAQKIKPHEVSSLLQNVAIKMATTKADLEQFAESFKVTLPKQGYTEQDFNRIDALFKHKDINKSDISPQLLEEMAFWIAEKQRRSPGTTYDYEALKVKRISLGYKKVVNDKGMPIIRPLCAEETIRTLMRVMLYNPKTKCLDISLLPESIQATCLPAFVAFVEKDKTLDKKNDDASSIEWLSLVSELSDVTYLIQDVFEIAAVVPNFFKVMAHLFGISPTVKPEEFGRLISTANRSLDFIVNDQQGALNLIIKNKEKYAVFNETAYFIKGHAHVPLEKSSFSQKERANTANVLAVVRDRSPLKCNEYHFVDFNHMPVSEFKKIVHDNRLKLDDLYEKVITTGRLEFLKILEEFRPGIASKFIDECIKSQNVVGLQSLIGNKLEKDWDYLNENFIVYLHNAVVNGNKKLFEVLFKAGYRCNEDVIGTIVRHQKIDLLKLALSYRKDFNLNDINQYFYLENAIKDNNKELFKILFRAGYRCTESTIELIVEHRKTDILQLSLQY